MPCQSATNQLPQQPSTVLPANLPQTQGDWSRFIQRMQEVLASIHAASYVTGVNAVPTQYSVYDGVALPGLRIVGATASQDSTKVQFGTASLKLVATASTITVKLGSSGYPITIQSVWQWLGSVYCATDQTSLSGTLAIVTPSKTYSVDISGTVTASQWNRLYGDYDLTADTSTTCTLLLTLNTAVGHTYWLEAWQLEPIQGATSLPSPFIITSPPRTWAQVVDNGTKPQDNATYVAGVVGGQLTNLSFASGLQPVNIVSALPGLPSSNYPDGSLVVLTTDHKLYRNASGSWTKAVDGADLIANSITAGAISAGAINASAIAAGAITSPAIAAGAVQASNISVASLSAINANLGTVTAGILQDSAGKFVANLTNATQTIKDASNTTRVLIGNLGTDYGIQVFNASGVKLFDASSGAYYSSGATLDSLKPAQVGATAGATIGPGGNVNGSVDANGRALIDFSQGGHNYKTLDYIGDGTTYGRPLGSRLNAGNPLIDFAAGYHLNKNVDNIADGSTYGRVRALQLNSGIISAINSGRNFVANPNFLQNAIGIPDSTYVYGGVVADKWNIVGSLPSTSPVVRYSASIASRILQAFPIANGYTNGPQIYSDKFAVTAGSTYAFRAVGSFTVSGATIPAGVTLTHRVYLNFDDKNGALVRNDIFDIPFTSTGSRDNVYNGIVPTGAVACAVFVQILVNNTSSATTWPAGSSSFAEALLSLADYVQVANLDNEVNDGANYGRTSQLDLYNSGGFNRVGLRIPGSGHRIGDQRNLPMRLTGNIQASVPTVITYSASTGTPATATISVAAFTMLAGSYTVSYNAMSVGVTGTAGTLTTYFLYFDDATSAGGTQTLVATTNKADVFSGDGRVYVGGVVVNFPSSGTGSGTGGHGGIGGAVQGATSSGPSPLIQ